MDTTQREQISPELARELEELKKEAYKKAKENPDWWKTIGDHITNKEAYLEAARLGREICRSSPDEQMSEESQ